VTNAPPIPVNPQGGGGPRPPGGTGVMLRTVTGSTVIVDSNIAISLDLAARDPSLKSLNPAQRANVAFARSAGIVIATPETAHELAAGGGASATVLVTQEVPTPPAERAEIVNDLTAAGVNGAADREVVTQSLLAQTDPGVTPSLATADRGVVNALARLSGIRTDRLGGYQNVAEWLRYTRNTDSFTVTIRGRTLRVVPVQPVRLGPARPGGGL